MFTLREVLEIAITVAALGYIFSHLIKKQKSIFGLMFENRFFDLENFKYSTLVVAPAIILHELGHKFVSMAMGFAATYHLMPWGLGIGVFLRLIGSGFIFFIPGYVAPATSTAWDSMTAGQLGLVGFAGPLINLILFFTFWLLIKYDVKPKYNRLFWISKQINLMLFIFNMLPIPPLDGYKVVYGLWHVLGF